MGQEGEIHFGTDGWRAVMAEDFTFENVGRVTQAAADFFGRRKGAKRMVIGYDRRFLSNQFAAASADVLCKNGYEVILTDRPTPTPAISHAVVTQKARGGIVLTASHNPPRFNGFKLKDHHGGPASPELCAEVESFLGKGKPQSPSSKRSVRVKTVNILPAYFYELKKLVDFEAISRSGIKLGHDALFGAGAGCMNDLLAGTSCHVQTYNGCHDPHFGGLSPEPIPQNYGTTSKALEKNPVDFCLVTDGDADRIGGMDGRGEPLTTHQIISLLLDHFVMNRRGRGKVVKALTTTSMVDKICEDHGLPLIETGVGFKYICAEILKGKVLLGFEESGGIGFPDHLPERDGILAGLMVLEMLAVERRSLTSLLRRLEKSYGPHRYRRADLHYPLNKRASLMRHCSQNPPTKLLGSPICRIDEYDGVKLTAANGSWLMWRGSGTEPVLRIYAEANTEDRVRKLLSLGKKVANKFA